MTRNKRIKKFFEQKNNTGRYISLIIPIIIIPIVTYTIWGEIPLEAKTKAWEWIVSFANTWPGAFIIIMAIIPILSVIIYFPIKLILYLIDRGEKK